MRTIVPGCGLPSGRVRRMEGIRSVPLASAASRVSKSANLPFCAPSSAILSWPMSLACDPTNMLSTGLETDDSVSSSSMKRSTVPREPGMSWVVGRSSSRRAICRSNGVRPGAKA
jgi:hypothetical protein